jgi:hypothetical protein
VFGAYYSSDAQVNLAYCSITQVVASRRLPHGRGKRPRDATKLAFLGPLLTADRPGFNSHQRFNPQSPLDAAAESAIVMLDHHCRVAVDRLDPAHVASIPPHSIAGGERHHTGRGGIAVRRSERAGRLNRLLACQKLLPGPFGLQNRSLRGLICPSGRDPQSRGSPGKPGIAANRLQGALQRGSGPVAPSPSP